MKYIRILLLVGLVAFSGMTYGLESTKDSEWLNNYTGDMGNKYQIGMTLTYHGDQVTGSYFYTKYLKDIQLKEELVDGTKLLLKEYDEKGKLTALFNGRFVKDPSKDPRGRWSNNTGNLDKEVLVGNWQKLGDTTKPIPFYLSLNNATSRKKGEGRYAVAGVENDVEFEKLAQAFWKAVKNNDKAKVLKYIHYPVTARLGKERLELQNRDQLDAAYEKVFTQDFRDKIVKSVPHNMFVKYSGVMLGDGMIWFGSDGKVITINN